MLGTGVAGNGCGKGVPYPLALGRICGRLVGPPPNVNCPPAGDPGSSFDGILDGRSRGVFHGRILVRQAAQKTDAKQTNKNLLLSREALVHSIPQLEILADDVKCSHGGAVGQIGEEQLFYLRSRGISAPHARALLTWAFASEMVERVGYDNVFVFRYSPRPDTPSALLEAVPEEDADLARSATGLLSSPLRQRLVGRALVDTDDAMNRRRVVRDVGVDDDDDFFRGIGDEARRLLQPTLVPAEQREASGVVGEEAERNYVPEALLQPVVARTIAERGECRNKTAHS